MRMKNARQILLPFSWIYGVGVWLRNKCFDWNLLPSEPFPVPVIVVGNITAGGTGKTPHVECLIDVLSKRYKVAVLSRGYKRKTKGFVLADGYASAETLGDEPYQIFRKFPQVVVAVDADRREGIKKLLELPAPDRPEVILLDDAFQHRYVRPSLSILLTDSSRPYYNDRLLPVGMLRESKSGAKRADMVIVTKIPEGFNSNDYNNIEKKLKLAPKQELYFTSYDYKGLLPVFPESTQIKKETLERLAKEDYGFLLVTGIVNPEPLKTYLGQYTTDLKVLAYADHHAFTPDDIKDIKQEFDQLKSANKLIITTEKDAMRLMDRTDIPDAIKPCIFYQPIEVVFNQDEEESFKHKIYNHVDKIKRNSSLA